MKSPFSVWLLAVVVCLGSIAAGEAEDSGWKMPNLNPFAGKSAGGPPTSGWKMPRLWPQTAAPKRRSNQPSTLGKMTKGTQQFFSKTADALNPWDDKPEPPAKITGSNSIFTQQRKAAQQEKKNSFVSPASWMGGEKKSSSPKSVNDFLSQPRP